MVLSSLCGVAMGPCSPLVPCSPVLCPVVLCCRVVLWCPVLLLCLVCFMPLFGFSYLKNRCKICENIFFFLFENQIKLSKLFNIYFSIFCSDYCKQPDAASAMTNQKIVHAVYAWFNADNSESEDEVDE